MVARQLFRPDLYGYYDAAYERLGRRQNHPRHDIMDSRLAGMDIHLAKPLDEAKMINALKQCIAERSAVKLRNDL